MAEILYEKNIHKIKFNLNRKMVEVVYTRVKLNNTKKRSVHANTGNVQKTTVNLEPVPEPVTNINMRQVLSLVLTHPHKNHEKHLSQT